jgi:hypothetical protein
MINGKECDLRDQVCLIFCLILTLLRERGVNAVEAVLSATVCYEAIMTWLPSHCPLTSAPYTYRRNSIYGENDIFS